MALCTYKRIALSLLFRPSYAVRFAANKTPVLDSGRFIKHDMVQLRDDSTGILSPPTPLQDILKSIDSRLYTVQLVTEHPMPIVKIINQKEAYNQKKAMKERERANRAKNMTKEVQMTWGVAAGDLEHKVQKIRKELEKGTKVDVVIAPKKGQTLPKPGEMEEMVEEMLTGLQDIAKEWKTRDIQRTMTAVYLQSLVGKASPLVSSTGIASEPREESSSSKVD